MIGDSTNVNQRAKELCRYFSALLVDQAYKRTITHADHVKHIQPLHTALGIDQGTRGQLCRSKRSMLAATLSFIVCRCRPPPQSRPVRAGRTLTLDDACMQQRLSA